MFQKWKLRAERVKRTRHQRTVWVWPNERREVTGPTWESRSSSSPESWISWSSHSPSHPCWRRRRWAASQGWRRTSVASDAGTRGGRWRKCRTDFLHRLNRFLFIWTWGNTSNFISASLFKVKYSSNYYSRTQRSPCSFNFEKSVLPKTF